MQCLLKLHQTVLVTLAKHSPVNSKTYAAVLHVLIKEFENRVQDCWKKSSIFGVFVILFSDVINEFAVNFQMKCIELQSDIQLKDKCDQVSLPDLYKLSLT